MTDLFIPIDRSQSTTSTIMTQVSTRTTVTAASANVPSRSTTPTTVSSRKSGINTTPRTTQSGSPSSIRYTISGPEPETQICQSKEIARSLSSNGRPNSVHFRRHSRNLSIPASPAQELSMRLSRATANSTTDGQPYAPEDITQNLRLAVGVTIDKLPVDSVVKATVSKQRNSFTNPNDPFNMRAESTLKNPSTPGKDMAIVDLESNTPSLAGPFVLRSHSRSSSRSDRSYPPPSFPPAFYGRSGDHGGYQSPPRSNLHGNTSSTSRPRSTSPLKHQIVDEGNSHPSTVRSKHSQSHRSPSVGRASSQLQQDLYEKNTLSRHIDNLSQSYKTVHYYTSCSHSSPPSTRPLNVQPHLDVHCDQPRSMLAGSCFDCDTIDRRDTESLILESYNIRISAHVTSLGLLITTLEASSPVSPLTPLAMTINLEDLSIRNKDLPESSLSSQQSTSTPVSQRGSRSSSVSEDEEITPISIRVEALQNRIAELTMLRDQEVKDLWKGYTQRWGPGTLGLVKPMDADEMSSTTPEVSRSTRTSMESERSHYGSTEGRMKVDWIRSRRP